MGGQRLIQNISVIKRVLGIVLTGTRPVLVNVTCWSPSDVHQPCLRTGSGRVMEELSLLPLGESWKHSLPCTCTLWQVNDQEGLSLTPWLCSLTKGTLT